MQAVYLFTNGDTTTRFPTPLEVHNYGCGVIELDGKVTVPKKMMINEAPQTNINENTPQENQEEYISNDGELYSDNLYLCCNIIEESYVGGQKLPVLRYLKRRNGNLILPIDHVIWLRVMRPTISSIRLYIVDENGKVLSLLRNKLNCTLLFVPT